MDSTGGSCLQSMRKDMKNSDEEDIFFYEFIKKNVLCDVRELVLTHSDRFPDFPLRFAAVQIECRQKTVRKLSKFIQAEKFLFPSLQAAEQSTHQCVAAYHSQIAGKELRVLDLTAGLGIDSMTLASSGNNVTAIEMDTERVSALRHNICELGIPDIEVIEADSIEWLKTEGAHLSFDLIFVDPARRDASNRRTYGFGDCLPDIISDYDLICSHAKRVMIKASPMLDLSMTIRQIPKASEIHMVCVKGECKEVLVIIDDCGVDIVEDVRIIAVDLNDRSDAAVDILSRFECLNSQLGGTCTIVDESDLKAGTFIYDPNAALHKVNCASALCQQFTGLKRLSTNTDLYWSETKIDDFPGRIFEVKNLIDKKKAKELKDVAAEVMTRNYPQAAEQLRSRLKLKPGGFPRYIIGFRSGSKNAAMIADCTRR